MSGGDPRFSHEEADLRAKLDELTELEVRQQVKELSQRFGLTRGDVLVLWRQQQKGASNGPRPPTARTTSTFWRRSLAMDRSASPSWRQ